MLVARAKVIKLITEAGRASVDDAELAQELIMGVVEREITALEDEFAAIKKEHE